MTYDKLTVALLSTLSACDGHTTNAQIAHYLLAHAGEADDLSVKELAAACHVGTGSVSRFAREAGFADFTDLRAAFAEFARSYEPAAGSDALARAGHLADDVCVALRRTSAGVDAMALERLVADIARYDRIFVAGLLKAQAAALDLQVDLLMQGKWADTCVALADQMDHIARAGRDELVIVFSFTGAYFEYGDIAASMRRLDAPKVWLVCGGLRPQPDYVSDLLLFDAEPGRRGHPYQLELVAGLIASEYAAATEGHTRQQKEQEMADDVAKRARPPMATGA